MCWDRQLVGTSERYGQYDHRTLAGNFHDRGGAGSFEGQRTN
jgi:hypothetical protein